MLEIFVIQVVAAILGTASIGMADWLYQSGRIRQRLHSLWVSCSIMLICLPMVGWTTNVFLGSGRFSEILVGLVEVIIFVWVYRDLRKPMPIHDFGGGLSPKRSSHAHVRPPSELNSQP